MTLRVLIVDDEPLAREGLRGFLTSRDDVELVGECGNGQEALEALRTREVDLVLLDVEMPGKSGFEVLDELDPEELPAVVFVTAFDEYAVKAFDVHAVDYLLKPVTEERFTAALGRVRERLDADAGRSMARRIEALVREARHREAGGSERLLVKSGSRSFFVSPEEIDWIEAAGNYATLHTRAGDHMIRTTMKALEERLDPERFARIHRSYIVNLDRIQEIQPWFKGDHLVILRDGTELSLTRKYRKRLRKRRGWEI